VIFARFQLVSLALLVNCLGSESGWFDNGVASAPLYENFLWVFLLTLISVLLARFFLRLLCGLRFISFWVGFSSFCWLNFLFVVKWVRYLWVFLLNSSSNDLRLSLSIYIESVTNGNDRAARFFVNISESYSHVESHSILNHWLIRSVDGEGVFFVVEADSEAKVGVDA